MIKIFDWEIDLVSVNKMFLRLGRAGRKAVYSNEYRVFKQTIFYQLPRDLFIEKPYSIKILVLTSKDIDGILKCILDALKPKIIEDDRYIEELIVNKKRIRRGEKEHLTIWISTCKRGENGKEILCGSDNQKSGIC